MPIRWGFETEKTAKEFVIPVELPRYEPIEINVEPTGNMLTIMAEHPRL